MMPSRDVIAEEQVECCQLFRMFLQRCGYEVSTAHDGMSCVEAMQSGPLPEVLILSWELPWGEGEGILEWLRFQGVEDTAVVILTARMDIDGNQQEKALPRVTWLQRPFRLMDLLAAVQSTERVPRNSWRCLEALWRKTTRPIHGVLLPSEATTHQKPLPVASHGSPQLARMMQPLTGT